MLIGMFLYSSNPVITIVSDERYNIGYTSVLYITVRGSRKSLEAISRSLIMSNIESSIRLFGKTKTKGTLTIRGIDNLNKVCEMVPSSLPSLKEGQWDNFREALNIVSKKEHLTLSGLEKLITIKEGLDWA